MHRLPEIKIGLEGWFTIELIDAKTQRVKRRLRFRNLITDAGLDALGGASTLSSLLTNGWIAVGTDSTAPANGDTTLGAEVSPSSTNRTDANGGFFASTSYTPGPPDYWSYFRTWLLTETQGNGNLTEVGIFSANTTGTMFTRQLLKDSGGTPTTITKTSSDQLRINYELRMSIPQSDATSTVTISGTSYDITIRPLGASSTNHWGDFVANSWWQGGRNGKAWETNTLVNRTSDDFGSSGVNQDSVAYAAYTNGNKFRDVTIKWEPGSANFATGIGGIAFMDISNGGYLFQSVFSPKFAKDATKRLTLVFRLSWDRV